MDKHARVSAVIDSGFWGKLSCVKMFPQTGVVAAVTTELKCYRGRGTPESRRTFRSTPRETEGTRTGGTTVFPNKNIDHSWPAATE